MPKPKVETSHSGLIKITTNTNHFSYIPKCDPRNSRELEAWLKRTNEEIEQHHKFVKAEAVKIYLAAVKELEAKKNKPKTQTQVTGVQSAQV